MAKARVSDAEARFDALRRRVGLIAAPTAFVALLLVPMPGLSDQAHALAAISAMTVLLWVTEAIPLPAAALLGPALAAVFGVASPKAALAAFADPLIFLFMGGFMLAAALSRHGFDRRAALWLIARPVVAGSPARALIAIASISFGFSMWISNTATTAMLIPVALGLHQTMLAVVPKDDATVDRLHRFSGGMCLALAYAASLGGSATPIGTGPNVIAVGMLEAKTGARIDFLQWMSFGLPTAAAMTTLVVWGALRRFPAPVKRVEGLMEEVRRQLDELGPLKKAEGRTLMVFGLAVLGWLTPSLTKVAFGPTHAYAAWTKSHLAEGVVALVCACLLFFVPSGGKAEENDDRLLAWEDAQKMDWGTLFLLGGGLALGRMTFDTGLAEAVGRGILSAAGPIVSTPLGLTAAAVLLVVFLTEVTSNTATTSMMLPVLIGIAQASGFDATATAVAVTLAASYAFMLPVSTPPNAMAYGTRMVRLDAMVRFGIRLDLLGFVVLMVAVIAILPFALG
ncbi:MAG: DASS family sodium-coupled anion symporter [Myxococcota bacterium]